MYFPSGVPNTVKSVHNLCQNFVHRRLSVAGLMRAHQVIIFLRATAVPAGTAEARISYGNSVCLSVRLSQPGGIPRPGEIETPGLHNI